MEPDRLTIYLAIGVVVAAIAAITGPSPALLTLAQIVLVVEAVNRISAPGDEGHSAVILRSHHPEGE